MSSAKPTADANEVVNFTPQPDPGSAPPLVVSDYAQYDPAIAGSSVLYGRIEFALNSGERVFCKRTTDVHLYPDTTFTRWMIAKWAADRNHKTGGLTEPALDPSEYARVPAILSMAEELRARVVIRHVVCFGGGKFIFRGVPPGTYFIESVVVRYGGAYSDGPSGGLVETDTPDGLHFSEQGSSVSGGRAPSDDYLVVSKFAVTIKSGAPQSFNFAPTDFHVISHAFE